MTPSTRLAWLAVVLCVLLAGCAHRRPDPPRLHIVDLRLEDMTLFEQRYRVTVRISNPNDFALPVDRVHYEVWFDGIPFAEGNSVESFNVPAFGDTRFDVIVSSSLLRTAQHLGRLLEQGGREFRYEMKGYAVIDLPLAGRVPFSDSGSIHIPEHQRR